MPSKTPKPKKITDEMRRNRQAYVSAEPFASGTLHERMKFLLQCYYRAVQAFESPGKSELDMEAALNALHNGLLDLQIILSLVPDFDGSALQSEPRCQLPPNAPIFERSLFELTLEPTLRTPLNKTNQ